MEVILIEDHVVLRQGLKSLLETECGARVVCDVGTAEEGVAFFDSGKCDLVILDLTLPGRDGIWATRQIKQRSPQTPVLILSMHMDEDIVTRALRAGADAYVVKSAAYNELVEAIEAVRHGRRYLHPDLSGARRRTPSESRPFPPLSETEREVLRLLGQGMEEGELASVLGIPTAAVEAVLRSLVDRLKVADIAELRHLGLRLKDCP